VKNIVGLEDQKSRSISACITTGDFATLTK